MLGYRDGRTWQIGSGSDVAWIEAALPEDGPLKSLVPPIFESYCTIDLPTAAAEPDRSPRQRHFRHDDQALVEALSSVSDVQQWWLGYLEYGPGTVLPFDVPRTSLFTWSYVLICAGPHQAATWRADIDAFSLWKSGLPELMFPVDRTWLFITDWDEFHHELAGPRHFVDSVLEHPGVRARGHRVDGLDAP